jgi:multiple sugar transport system substrate-binding protein
LHNREAQRAYGRPGISRQEFLKLGGAELAGVALLCAAGCGGGEEGKEGADTIAFTSAPTKPGSFRTLINRFDQQTKGEILATSDGYFDQIRAELQSGQ